MNPSMSPFPQSVSVSQSLPLTVPPTCVSHSPGLSSTGDPIPQLVYKPWGKRGRLVDWLPGALPCAGSARPTGPGFISPSAPAPGRRGPAALVSEVFEQHLGGHILQSLDGFVFALNQEGKFLYISETVSIYLGLSQVEMTGSSVFDYIHPGDHSEVLEQLGLRAPTPGPPTPPSVSSSSSSSSSSLADTPEIGPHNLPSLSVPEASLTKVPPSSLVQERSFFVRMKSTLTKRGLHVKASGYKQVIHVTGRLRAHALGLVALGHTLPPAPLAELPLHGHMIVFRLSLGLTILACESRVSDHMDLGPSELVGRSCYQFVHGQDATRIRQSHVDCETRLHPPRLPTTTPTQLPYSLVPESPSSGLPTVPPAALTALGAPCSTGRAARRLSNGSGCSGESGRLWGLSNTQEASLLGYLSVSDSAPLSLSAFAFLSPPCCFPVHPAAFSDSASPVSSYPPVSALPLSPPHPWAGPSAGQGSGDDWLLPLAAAHWGLRVAAVCGHGGWQWEEPRGAPRALGQPRAQPS
ncbi:neuronal PAS domain-containing protein 1 isoform X1 [Aotus nancymaae]|uniref:neuronal PAS domain-containing protein 1 isoform X1 n=1 Tax=Aotus nancymaae TaxID=37293 RepID=UPI0030FE9907